jgi:hypothetical protein
MYRPHDRCEAHEEKSQLKTRIITQMSRRCSYPSIVTKGEGRSLINDNIHGRCRFLGRNQRVNRRSTKRKVRRGIKRKERSLIKDRVHNR